MNKNIIFELIEKSTNWDYSTQTLQQLINDKTLDKEFDKLTKIEVLVNKYKSFNIDNSSIQPELVDKAISNIKYLKEKINNFYEDFFKKHKIIGNDSAAQSPDIIIILGANNLQFLEYRVKVAYDLANKFPSAILLCSGGGFQAKNTEAQRTQKALINLGVTKDRIYLEEYSMDTIGNALFSFFIIKEDKVLNKLNNLLIITSAFHSIRSYKYFNFVFPESNNFKIAIHGVPTIKSKERINNVVTHELQTEATATRDIFKLTNLEGEIKLPLGSNSALLLQLFQHHNLYKNRYDLIRRFANYIS